MKRWTVVLLGVSLGSCAAEPPAGGVDGAPMALEPAALSARRAPSRSPIDAALAARLASASPTESVEVEVRVAVPSFRPADLPDAVTTMTVTAGEPSYTLNGRPITVDELTRVTDSVRATINQGLQHQFAERRRLVREAIQRAGLEGQVSGSGMSWFKARLTAEELGRALAALGDRVRLVRLPQSAESTVSLTNDLHDSLDAGTDPLDDGDDGALENMGIVDFAHGYGMRGQGIGIWHNEGNLPYHDRPGLSDADLRDLTGAHWQKVKNGGVCRFNDECCSNQCTGLKWKTCSGVGDCRYGDIRSQEHSTMVAMMAHGAAPDAVIYHTATTFEDCMLSDVLVNQTNPPIYVGAQSWSLEGAGATDGSYNVIGECNAEWDKFIASSRIAHFHSSGNAWANFVGSPARAYNVTAVGRYFHETNTIVDETGYKNPDTYVEKPEILAPGTNITAAPGWTRSGSSLSSPMVAGFAADMMSGSPFFRNQPQAVRAYLIAGAHDVYDGVGFANGNGMFDGAGRVSFLDSWFYRSGKTWNGGNGAFFVNNKITETVTLTAGKRYTIAIAWLADGDWAYSNADTGKPRISQRMSLTVTKTGQPTQSSAILPNNFQMVDFTVPPGGGGTYTVTIERTYNSGQGNVDLALTVGEHG